MLTHRLGPTHRSSDPEPGRPRGPVAAGGGAPPPPPFLVGGAQPPSYTPPRGRPATVPPISPPLSRALRRSSRHGGTPISGGTTTTSRSPVRNRSRLLGTRFHYSKLTTRLPSPIQRPRTVPPSLTLASARNGTGIPISNRSEATSITPTSAEAPWPRSSTTPAGSGSPSSTHTVQRAILASCGTRFARSASSTLPAGPATTAAASGGVPSMSTRRLSHSLLLRYSAPRSTNAHTSGGTYGRRRS